MNKLSKLFNKVIPYIFTLLTLIEIIIYLSNKVNLYGVIYLIINMFISFVLLTISLNYNKGNKKVRFSKSIIVVILGLFSGFVLSNINFNSYVEVSNFYNHIFLISRVFKTIIYTLIVLLLIFEEKIK